MIPSPSELEAARTRVAIARRPLMGCLRITGGDAATFLHNFTTHDVKGLPVGSGLSAAIINQRAGVLDLVDVYAMPEGFLVVTGPERAEADLAWLDRYLITEDVVLTDYGSEHALLFLVGPEAPKLLAALSPSLQDLPAFGHAEAEAVGVPVRVLRTHDWSAPAYHLLVPKADLDKLHTALTSHPDHPATPISEETEELLRLEAGVPRVGRELVETRNPWESRLDESLSLHKGCYLGQEIVARLNTYDKVQRYMVGLRWPATTLPGADARLFAMTESGEQEVGQLTSAAQATEGEVVAMAYVKAAYATPGQALTLRGPEGENPVTVRDLPYWEGKTRSVARPS